MGSFYIYGYEEVILIKSEIIKTYSKKQLFRKRVSKIIAITGSIILLVMALSYYGQHTGSFVISMKNADRKAGLALVDTDDFADTKARITATPLSNAIDTEYEAIPFSTLDETVGSHNYKDPSSQYDKYFAYTFYLLNQGEETVDYIASFTIDNVTRNLDSILRICIIEGNVDAYAETRTETVYAKAREDEGHEGEPEPIVGSTGETPLKNLGYHLPEGSENNLDVLSSLGLTTPFASDNKVFQTTNHDFKVGQMKKYTVVMWLDGWDAQSSNKLLNGALKLSLQFTLIGRDNY